MPKVSVIVPNYNHEKFLSQRLDSILNQTYKDFELIILDDASSDYSVKIIKRYVEKYPDVIQFVPSKRNSGSPFYQWNKGINLAKGDFIWIAESDDLASLHFLEDMIPFIEANPQVGLICCKSNAINADGAKISEYHPMFKGFEDVLFPDDSTITHFVGLDFISQILIEKCVIPNVSGIIMNKVIYKQAGGLNLKLKRVGDYDLYFRLLNISDIAFLNRSLNSTRYHDDKLTATNNEQSFRELRIMLQPIFTNLNLTSKERLKIMSFYFTVYKYDIFLNEKFTNRERLAIFKELSSLSGLLHFEFLRFCLQRAKINLSKKLK